LLQLAAPLQIQAPAMHSSDRVAPPRPRARRVDLPNDRRFAAGTPDFMDNDLAICPFPRTGLNFVAPAAKAGFFIRVGARAGGLAPRDSAGRPPGSWRRSIFLFLVTLPSLSSITVSAASGANDWPPPGAFNRGPQ